LTRREWIAAAWFGPKGFASVFFPFLLLQASMPNNLWIFHLLAVMVCASIIVHSSTDVLIARWFDESKKKT
jgi:NhaP-type Na+/H+ or K+/H+ antiporter